MRAIRRFLQDDSAATAVEYSVMVALIIITCLSAVSALGGQNGSLWGQTNTKVQTHLSGTP